MSIARHRFGSASAHYSKVDLSSRIEGASPHQLVAILFEELLGALDQMTAAAARRDHSRLGESQSRALSMISGLQTSLDMERGGEIARNLAAIYAGAVPRVMAAARGCDAAALTSVRAVFGDIAEAWEAIG
jgi:flagellar secretion chaperone FliS